MSGTGKKVRRIAYGLAKKLTEIRRDIHMHPERGFQEKRTSALVAEMLEGLGVEVRRGVGRTGVVGLLKGKKGKGRTVGLRADMDALPIQEENDVPYRSQYDGVMHACGHDMHTTMLMGTAMILSQFRNQIRGNVKFIFQPAEEIMSGAEAMIKDGVMDNPKVDCILGVHVRVDLPAGVIGVTRGPAMAAFNAFKIKLVGKGGHGGYPHTTRDPLQAFSDIYDAFHTIRRNLNSFEPYVLSICSVHGGSAFNIIPSEVEVLGTLRTFDEKARKFIQSRMRAIVKSVSELRGVDCRLSFSRTGPAVINDSVVNDLAVNATADLGLKSVDVDPVMGSEDFSYYLKKAPGAFVRIGSLMEDEPRVAHNPRADFHEGALPAGAALMAQAALRYLDGK